MERRAQATSEVTRRFVLRRTREKTPQAVAVGVGVVGLAAEEEEEEEEEDEEEDSWVG